MYLLVHYVHLNIRHQVWGRTGNRSVTEVEFHHKKLWETSYPFSVEKLGKKGKKSRAKEMNSFQDLL